MAHTQDEGRSEYEGSDQKICALAHLLVFVEQAACILVHTSVKHSSVAGQLSRDAHVSMPSPSVQRTVVSLEVIVGHAYTQSGG